METGVVTLINTKTYPFNDSIRTVALRRERKDADYFVLTEVLRAEGEAGEVRVTGKAVNGFQIAFDGPARLVEVKYLVLGVRESESPV